MVKLNKILIGGSVLASIFVIYHNIFNHPRKIRDSVDDNSNIKDESVDLTSKLSNIDANTLNIPKLKLSIRILIKSLEELEKGDNEALAEFKEYIGDEKYFYKFKSDITKIKEWWLSPQHPLEYDDTINGAHGSLKHHIIKIGPVAMKLPVIQNIRAHDSIVATLFHESTHAVLSFNDYSTKNDKNIDINDVHAGANHGHYLYPSQCKQLSVFDNAKTLKNPQCWQEAFITNYAYSKLCKVVNKKEYNKKICKYSESTNADLAKNWLTKIIKSLNKIENSLNYSEKMKEVANILLKKNFSLFVASHDDECKKDEKFHGNKKNIVVCQSFMKEFNDVELTKFFFDKLKDCHNPRSCDFNYSQLKVLDDLIGNIEYNAEVI